MVIRLLPVLLILAFSATAHAQADARRHHYVDVYEYFTTDAQYESWFTLSAQLDQDFDDICGDTFCEGDYSNIQSLRLRCSVETFNGRIGQCLWIFAGSYEDVDSGSGRIDVHSEVWRCAVPLAPQTTIDGLLAALAVPHPLYATLPGTQVT
ncbi:MAG: hypothetical protein ABIR62_08275, partial [Dokdonella sp.]|uniref:hypothetical protein n=1 Tax=Dokdonella sp. TaxID=2291710 RepID=UPI003264AE9B